MSLRHDLLTSGWSMLHTPNWPTRLLADVKDWPVQFGVATYNMDSTLKGFADELSWLLHEALPEEAFCLVGAEIRRGYYTQGWHPDGCYLRAILTCQGEGTIAALSYDNNVQTPPGYTLILTGSERAAKTGIAQTWHRSPPVQHYDRRLVLINFLPSRP